MPLLVWDPQYLREQARNEPSELLLATPIEWFESRGEEQFFNGPVSSRVAVLDFDAESGGLKRAAEFLPRGIGNKVSCYDVELPDIDDADALLKALESDAFTQVNAYATVMKTIQFFENPDALGRRVRWAFDSPQLLVLPRAGLLANAFYERESGSVQFFYCPSSGGDMIYTALSHDIIVHETAHAILDGIAPDLYHSTRTQSIAIHEAIADLAAIVLTLLNEMIIFSLCDISGAELDIASALAKVAEEFGSEMRHDVGADFLRLLKNKRTLHSDSTDLTNPYEVSEVMSGAVYQTFINCANGLNDKKSILGAARDVARMVFRALDYLPPGEASLADFGRAMVAAQRAIHAGTHTELRWLLRELVDRKVVRDESELEVDIDVVGRELKDVNCQKLLESKAAAENFAKHYRDLLRIPSRSRFTVQPRRVRTRVRSRSRKQRPQQDLIFRVAWGAKEEHDLGSRFASRWAYPVGTTLVLDWSTGRVLSVLTTDQGEGQHSDRDRTLRLWAKRGLLRTQKEAVGLDGRPRNDVIIAKQTGRTMRVTGSARVLCI